MYETRTAVLNCPCKEFPPTKNMVPILAAYYEARRRGAREGFVPVLVAAGEDSPLDGFQWMKNVPACRRRQGPAGPNDCPA